MECIWNSLASLTTFSIAQSTCLHATMLTPVGKICNAPTQLGHVREPVLQRATRSRQITNLGMRARSSSSRQSSYHAKVLDALVGQTLKHTDYFRLTILDQVIGGACRTQENRGCGRQHRFLSGVCFPVHREKNVGKCWRVPGGNGCPSREI